MVRRLVERVLPRGTRRRCFIGAVVKKARSMFSSMQIGGLVKPVRELTRSCLTAGVTYREWFCRLPADPSVLAIQRQWFDEWVRPLKVWVLVLEDGGDAALTEQSLLSQSWGLVEVVRVKASDLVSEFDRLSQHHPQDLVVLLRAGDRLRPDAVFKIAQAVWRDPWLELLYWDDDLAGLAEVWDWYLAGMPENVYFDDDLECLSQPRFKPGWSPDLLTCANYIGRAFAVRARSLVADTAKRYCQSELGNDGLGDDTLWWDLLLGLDLEEQQVSRLPAVLQAVDNRAFDHRDRVVKPHHLELVDRWLSRKGWPAKPVATEVGINLEWAQDRDVLVSIIIATRHDRALLEGALSLIRGANYPSAELIIVDNGGQSAENETWYQDRASDINPQVIWWEASFNYSAVNNRAAQHAKGEVLVFLNDDTAPGNPDWLCNLIGWAQRPEIGVVGLQLLDDDGLIQHGGVVIGMAGMAGHLFQGMAPHSDTLLGSTDWTRNTMAVTGACLAVRRSVFEQIGGFDERLELCGSDVVLGLRARQAGFRNVVSAATPVVHTESATRGTNIPEGDVFASYWAYQRWLMGGDPYFSPNLSRAHSTPEVCCKETSDVLDMLSEALGRSMEVFYQRNEIGEAHALAYASQADRHLVSSVRQEHRAALSRCEVKTVNWFVPEFQNPFYGGIHTVFRLADHLARNHGVKNRFMVMSGPTDHDVRWYRSGITAAFKSLADSPIAYHDSFAFDPDDVPHSDAAIATMWTTAYFAARTPEQARRFYLIQDFEPMFYPAGTLYALAEHSYRLGLYGLCNTGHLADIYRDRYGGVASHFWPAVDNTVFHDRNRVQPDPDRPVTVFLYARPGHLRNCWELAARAIRLVKDELVDDVRIVTAGSWAFPEHMDSLITHMGQLDYAETGPLYRTCDIGVALTTSEHPSYLPLELMACGTAVVTFENPAGDWLLRHGDNCMQAPQVADGLAAEIVALVRDPVRRQRLAKQGLADIAARHASWDENLAGVYEYLCEPEMR
ncbi:MAG: glycosyltransferase [Acidimicrobiia bacterium]|nr:glycosyltransferase [Acidimicrobiia bacterium]